MYRNGVIDVIVGYEHAGDVCAGRSSLRGFAIRRQSLSLEMPTICSRKSCAGKSTARPERVPRSGGPWLSYGSVGGALAAGGAAR